VVGVTFDDFAGFPKLNPCGTCSSSNESRRLTCRQKRRIIIMIMRSKCRRGGECWIGENQGAASRCCQRSRRAQ